MNYNTILFNSQVYMDYEIRNVYQIKIDLSIYKLQ